MFAVCWSQAFRLGIPNKKPNFKKIYIPNSTNECKLIALEAYMGSVTSALSVIPQNARMSPGRAAIFMSYVEYIMEFNNRFLSIPRSDFETISRVVEYTFKVFHYLSDLVKEKHVSLSNRDFKFRQKIQKINIIISLADLLQISPYMGSNSNYVPMETTVTHTLHPNGGFLSIKGSPSSLPHTNVSIHKTN